MPSPKWRDVDPALVKGMLIMCVDLALSVDMLNRNLVHNLDAINWLGKTAPWMWDQVKSHTQARRAKLVELEKVPA